MTLSSYMNYRGVGLLLEKSGSSVRFSNCHVKCYGSSANTIF